MRALTPLLYYFIHAGLDFKKLGITLGTESIQFEIQECIIYTPASYTLRNFHMLGRKVHFHSKEIHCELKFESCQFYSIMVHTLKFKFKPDEMLWSK